MAQVLIFPSENNVPRKAIVSPNVTKSLSSFPNNKKKYSFPHQKTTTTTKAPRTFDSVTDFHFPVSLFDEQEGGNILSADDLLDDLDIFPRNAVGGPGNDVSENLLFPSQTPKSSKQHYRPVSPSSISSNRTPSFTMLESVTSFSVPNPILKYDEDMEFLPPAPQLFRTSKGRKHTTLTNPKIDVEAATSKKRKLSAPSMTEEKEELSEEEMLERR